MYNVRCLLFALSFCASVCADPLADSLMVLGESLQKVADFLPKASGPLPVEDFSVYKEFDYADAAPGVAQPKLKIGLRKDALIIYGPELVKVEKNIFRAPAGIDQSFRYPVQAATKMKWNDAGQIIDEGPKQIYVVEDQPTPGLATKGAAKKLAEAFIEWKNSGKDFNIQDWWTKSAAPKKNVEIVQPKFFPGSVQNIPIADAGGMPAANTEIIIGLVPSADGKFDLVVWGPMLTGAKPQDFDKGYASLEYPVEKAIKIQWSSPKQIKNMGPFGAFTLVSSKEFAAKEEAGKLFTEKIEKKKPIFDAEFAALKSQVDVVSKLGPISKSNVAQFQDAANKLVAFFNKEAPELMSLLSDKNGPNTPAWSPLLDMASGLESLYRVFRGQIEKDQKRYADILAGMSGAAKEAQKIAAEKGADNQSFKNDALKSIVNELQKNSDKQTDLTVKTSKLPMLTSLQMISGQPIAKAPFTAKLFWKKSIQPKTKAPDVDPGKPDKEPDASYDLDAEKTFLLDQYELFAAEVKKFPKSPEGIADKKAWIKKFWNDPKNTALKQRLQKYAAAVDPDDINDDLDKWNETL